jgi:Protein of unknown function (DUF3421)
LAKYLLAGEPFSPINPHFTVEPNIWAETDVETMRTYMSKALKIAALAFAFLILHGTMAHAAWQHMYANSPIPVNAAPFPNDFRPANAPGDMPGPYVCRAAFMGGEQPGWTNPGDGACHIGWGGLEHLVSTYDMWVEDWQPATSGNVPVGAIIFGEEQAQVPPPSLSPQKWPRPRSGLMW